MRIALSSHNTNILAGVGAGVIQTAVAMIVALLQVRIVMEYLPRDAAGIWFLFLSIGAYLAFFDLGFGPTLSREVAFSIANNQDGKVETANIIATCQRIFVVLAVIVFAISSTTGIAVITASNLGPEVLFAWLIFAAGASLNLLGGAAFSSLYGMGHIGVERLCRAFFQITGLMFSFFALKIGFGLPGLALVWVVQSLVARVAAWHLLYHYHPSLRNCKGVYSRPLAIKLAVPSLKWAGMNFGAILILNSNNVLIALLLGVDSIPAYEAASKVVVAILTLSMLSITTSVPFLSKLYAQGDASAFKTLFYRNIRFGMACVMVGGSFFSVFGERIISLWLGPGNFVGFSVVWALVAVIILEAHHTIHAMVAMSAGHIVFLKIALIAAILKVIFSVFFVINYGVVGLPLGTFFAQILTNTWYVPRCVFQIFNISPGGYFKEVLSPLLSLGGILLVANSMLITFTSNGSKGYDLIAGFILSALCAAICFYYLVLPKTDKQSLVASLTR